PRGGKRSSGPGGDCERAPHQRLGLAEPVGGLEQPGQVVEGDGHVGMLGAEALLAWLPPLLWSPWPRPQTKPITGRVERIRSGNTRSKTCTRCVRFCWLRCRRSAPRTRKG